MVTKISAKGKQRNPVRKYGRNNGRVYSWQKSIAAYLHHTSELTAHLHHTSEFSAGELASRRSKIREFAAHLLQTSESGAHHSQKV